MPAASHRPEITAQVSASEDHRGLAGYTGQRIDVNVGRGRLVIHGEALRLKAMDREALLVTGRILSVEFE